jgi:MFS family permease
MQTYLHQLRSFGRDVRLFLITPALIGFTVFGGIYTVLFNLYLVRLGYEPPFIGLVNAISQFALALFALPASALGLRLGTRRTMIGGLMLVVVGHALPILAEFVPGNWRPGWILATYLTGGLGLALYFVNASPWVMSVTTPVERSHVFSVQAALWPLAGFVGSLVGGALPAFFGRLLGVTLESPAAYRYPLLIAAGLLLIGVVALWLTQEAPPMRSNPSDRPHGGATPLTIILIIALVGVLRGSGEGGARTFFNLYMDSQLGAPPALIGALLAAGQLISVPAALMTPFFAARWGHDRSIIGGTLALGILLLPFALIQHWVVAGIAFMAMLVVISIARPAYMVYSQEIVGARWQGAMSAATTMAIGISWSLMAFGGGYVIALFGYPTLFLIGALLTALGSLLFWGYFRSPRGEFARQPAELQ